VFATPDRSKRLNKTAHLPSLPSSSPEPDSCLSLVGGLCAMPTPEHSVCPLGEEDDYTTWLAHSTDPGDYKDGCILGYKEQFLRLRKSSVCQNGRDYVVAKQPSVCPCSLEDFLWYQHFSDPSVSPCPTFGEVENSCLIQLRNPDIPLHQTK
jgi:hypothetical protein